MQVITKNFPFLSTPETPACHASTILKLADGSFVCAWFAGSREGKQDVSIWFSKQENGVWRTPEKIARVEDAPHWNPVLFQKQDGTICLFYKIGFSAAERLEWKTMLTTSRDGVTWCEPRELLQGDTSGGRGPVKNKPISLTDGKLLAPGSTELGCWLPFVDGYTEENGWKKVPIPTDPKVGMIQPTLWEWEPNKVSALMRTDCGKLYRSDSLDGGESWCMAYETDMPNNNSGVDCVRMADGTQILVCNPVGENHGSRSPLTVFSSQDNGVTFRHELDLETEDGEFSYPAVIADGNRIYVTYTYRREGIAFCEILL